MILGHRPIARGGAAGLLLILQTADPPPFLHQRYYRRASVMIYKRLNIRLRFWAIGRGGGLGYFLCYRRHWQTPFPLVTLALLQKGIGNNTQTFKYKVTILQEFFHPKFQPWTKFSTVDCTVGLKFCVHVCCR